MSMAEHETFDTREQHSEGEPVRRGSVAASLVLLPLMVSFALALLLGVAALVCYSAELVARLTGISTLNVLLATLALGALTTAAIITGVLVARLDRAARTFARGDEVLTELLLTVDALRIDAAEEPRAARRSGRRTRARRAD